MSILFTSAIRDIHVETIPNAIADAVYTHEVVNAVQPLLDELGANLKNTENQLVEQAVETAKMRSMLYAAQNEQVEREAFIRQTLINELGETITSGTLKALLEELDMEAPKKKFRVTQTVEISVEVEIEADYEGDGSDLIGISDPIAVTNNKADSHEAEINDLQIEWGIEKVEIIED